MTHNAPLPSSSIHAATRVPVPQGVVISGTGSALPTSSLSNKDLEKVMDTSDEWIVQRTGISQRFRIDPTKGECTLSLSTEALNKALAAAGLKGSDLDHIIVATMTPEMACPATACRVAHHVGATRAGAFDLNAACSGFVYGLNVAHDLVKCGSYKHIGLVGADTVTNHMDYSNAGRSTAIIFGDGAGAAIISASPKAGTGILAQSMHCDGEGWKEIYIPQAPRDFPTGVVCDSSKYGKVQMNGAAVFKFAVGTFSDLIQDTLDKANVRPDEVDMYVCHQSNSRILTAARERFGIAEDKLYINIDRVGNTVGASVPLCLDELTRAGRIKPGHKVMFVAFGGGLTWGSSLWQL